MEEFAENSQRNEEFASSSPSRIEEVPVAEPVIEASVVECESKIDVIDLIKDLLKDMKSCELYYEYKQRRDFSKAMLKAIKNYHSNRNFLESDICCEINDRVEKESEIYIKYKYKYITAKYTMKYCEKKYRYLKEKYNISDLTTASLKLQVNSEDIPEIEEDIDSDSEFDSGSESDSES